MKLPDFTELFFSTFKDRKKPLRYVMRHDANQLHDLMFLSSMIHDAVIDKFELIAENSLVLDITRDCWELRQGNKLPYCKAQVMIEGVEDNNIEEFGHILNLPHKAIIDHVSFDSNWRSHSTNSFCLFFEILADEQFAYLRVQVNRERFELSLVDQEEPRD